MKIDVFHVAPSQGSPTIALVRAAGQRVKVYAERVEPQPPDLPPGLVLIVLPENCYIDPSYPGSDIEPDDDPP